MRFRTFAREFLKAVALLAILASVGFATSTDAQANDDREIRCLALTIYYEARGESERGKLAVGYVVINDAPKKGCTQRA
jgi:spore germination cell wall hydrolase CwlJ-like protein